MGCTGAEVALVLYRRKPLPKIDGRWKFRKDQQINTYFAAYETGWKDLAQRVSTFFRETTVDDLIAEMNGGTGETAGNGSKPA